MLEPFGFRWSESGFFKENFEFLAEFYCCFGEIVDGPVSINDGDGLAQEQVSAIVAYAAAYCSLVRLYKVFVFILFQMDGYFLYPVCFHDSPSFTYVESWQVTVMSSLKKYDFVCFEE